MREYDYSLIEQIFTECSVDAPGTIPGPGSTM